MKKNASILIGYGLFLILIGLLGFLSNPEKAKTALMSGGTFGLLSIGLGFLALKGWSKARPIALGMCLFLGVVFIWRSSVSWMAVAGGQSEKTLAAVLISSMLAATIFLAVMLLRRGGQSGAAAEGRST